MEVTICLFSSLFISLNSLKIKIQWVMYVLPKGWFYLHSSSNQWPGKKNDRVCSFWNSEISINLVHSLFWKKRQNLFNGLENLPRWQVTNRDKEKGFEPLSQSNEWGAFEATRITHFFSMQTNKKCGLIKLHHNKKNKENKPRKNVNLSHVIIL